MKKASCDKTSKGYALIRDLGITILVFLIVVGMQQQCFHKKWT